MPACLRCGEHNPGRARFCLACGAPFGDPEGRPREERRVVTVLFADVVGFTSIAEKLDPEDVRSLLRPLYALLRGTLVRFGGTIEQFTGDGVMALFGAPVAHGDDPERAVRAALAIREAVIERNAASPGRELDVRIGVNTGTVIVAPDPLGRAGERLVAGDAVNLAARLQTAAPVNGILVGAVTYGATRSAIEYLEREAIAVKGKAVPVEVWEAVASRARYGTDLAGEPAAPLVGRDDELALLAGALDDVRARREPRFVAVVGDAGAGKTRLLLELFRYGGTVHDLMFWRQGRCLPYGEQSTFGALAEVVKAQAGVLETDGPVEAARKLREDLERRHDGDELEWLDAQVRLLVGLGDEGWTERAGTFTAWRRWLEALATVHPLVVVIEDMQWADPPLLEFLGSLDRIHGVPLLVVGSARPELLDQCLAWSAERPRASTIELAALPADSMSRLVEALLAGEGRPELHAHVLASAGGNPFFAEEYVRMFRDRGFLGREGGDWGVEDLPVTVQATIAARIDALSVEEKALLLDASVVGKVFWRGAVARLRGAAPTEVDGLLASLEERELVQRQRRSTIAGEEELAFRHTLVREVAYALIPRGDRARQHRAAATWVESLSAGGEHHAETRAHHYAEALQYAQQTGGADAELERAARVALRDAGRRASRLFAHARAVDYLERALALWPADDVERAAVLLELGIARSRAGQGGHDELAAARAAFEAAGDPERAAEACLELSYLTFGAGQRDECLALLHAARELLLDRDGSSVRVHVLATLSANLSIADRISDALEIGGEAVALADRLGDDGLRARALRNRGTVRVVAGDDGGFDEVAQSIEISRRLNSPDQAPALANLGALWTIRGDLRRAWTYDGEARVAAERFGDEFLLLWARMKRAHETYWRGHWDETVAIVDQDLERDADGYTAALLRILRGKVRLARGDVAGGVADTGAALVAGRGSLDSQLFYPALAAHAEAERAAGRAEAGDALLDELLGRLTGRESFMGSYWADIAFALVRLGRGDELAPLAAKVQLRTRWLDAAEQLGRGDAQAAAATFDDIGSAPDAAVARLVGAERLGAADPALLAPARGFFAEVGAAALLARADALAAAVS
jgi:class 3 adenylate cyclase/tetratricopeptide (TPR) repeat protein